MDCLKDYIGIRHCSQEEPKSGLFVNNLPGMSTELADKIATSEQMTFVNVWDDVQTRAIGRFIQDFQMYLFDIGGTGFNKTLYTTKRLTKPRSYELLDSLAAYRGVYVYVPISRYVKFHLQSVQIFIKAIATGVTTANIKILDLQKETVVKTILVPIVVGLNSFETDTHFDANTGAIELFIGIDCTSITTIKTHDSHYGYYQGECFHNSSDLIPHDVQMHGATIGLSDAPLNENISFAQYGQGLTLDAQVVCSVEPFLCENKHNLKTAFLYLLGSEMLFQKISSNLGSRVNWFTSGNLEQTQNTRDLFEREYVKAMKNAIRSLNIPDSGVCFECDENSGSFDGGSMP